MKTTGIAALMIALAGPPAQAGGMTSLASSKAGGGAGKHQFLETVTSTKKHGGHGAMSAGKSVSAAGAFARASIGAAKTGAAYVTIHNPTDHADRLIGARADAAKRVELHTHKHENGVMRMRPIEAIEIPAGGMAELKPGGDHVMFMGLKAPLKKGGRFPLTLVFEKAGEIEVMVEIGSVGAGSAGHGSHKN